MNVVFNDIKELKKEIKNEDYILDDYTDTIEKFRNKKLKDIVSSIIFAGSAIENSGVGSTSYNNFIDDILSEENAPFQVIIEIYEKLNSPHIDIDKLVYWFSSAIF